MSTWEERMSARAQERIRAEQEREQARQEAEWAAYEAQRIAQGEAARPAVPPDGCSECWHWTDSKFGFQWCHGESVRPGPAPPDAPFWGSGTKDADWCYHACHGDDAPVFCGPVALASC